MTHPIASYATIRKRHAPEPISACVVVIGAEITGEHFGVAGGVSPGRRRHGSSHLTLEPSAQGLGCNHVGLLACVEGESEFLAPMVTEAQYAVIGDMHEVVAAMNVELRRRKE
jgi:hypothetical protein